MVGAEGRVEIRRCASRGFGIRCQYPHARGAPEVWPTDVEQLACLAETFGLSPAYVAANADAVYRLDKAAQEKALRSIQRIADIFSHIAEDRNALCGRLQTIASLTSLQNPVLS